MFQSIEQSSRLTQLWIALEGLPVAFGGLQQLVRSLQSLPGHKVEFGRWLFPQGAREIITGFLISTHIELGLSPSREARAGTSLHGKQLRECICGRLILVQVQIGDGQGVPHSLFILLMFSSTNRRQQFRNRFSVVSALGKEVSNIEVRGKQVRSDLRSIPEVLQGFRDSSCVT